MLEHTEEAKAFYRSSEWLRCRAAYIRSVDGLCERCLKQGRYTPGTIVHHKVHLNSRNIQNRNITLNFDNLELLCQDCHNKEHFQSPAKRCSFDAAGNLIIKGE